MPHHDDNRPRNILATGFPEAAAQVSITVALAALQAVAVELRAVREALDDTAPDSRTTDASGPDTLASFIRGSIETVLVDNLEPAIRTLAKATTATHEDLAREWHEQQGDSSPIQS